MLAQAPDHPVAHHRLAVIADLDRDFARAAQHYARALQRNGDDPQLLHDVGYSYLLQDRPNDAIPYLAKALERNPEFELAARKLADAYVRTGQEQLAQQVLASVMPAQLAQAELKELRTASDPSAKPSLFGRMRQNLEDLRPAAQTDVDPTQELLADLQQAKLQGNQQRLQREAERAQRESMQRLANPVQQAGLMQPDGSMHDSQLRQAIASIDRAGQSAQRAPLVLDPSLPRGYAPANGHRGPGVPAAEMAGTSPWNSAAAGNAGGFDPSRPDEGRPQPSGYAASMGADSVAIPNQQGYGPVKHGQYGVVPTGSLIQPSAAGPAASDPRLAQQAGPDGQPVAGGMAEIYYGNQRGALGAWPRTDWRHDGMATANQRGNGPGSHPQGMPQSHPSTAAAPIVRAGGSGVVPETMELGHARPSEYDATAGAALVNYQGAPAGYHTGTQPQLYNYSAAQGGYQAMQPQPATPANAADDYRAAASMGMGIGPSPMFPVMRQASRLTPGTNSAWNGAQLPQAGRSLPTERPMVDLRSEWRMPGQDALQGTAVTPGPNSHGQRMPDGSHQWTTVDQYSPGRGWGVESTFQPQAATTGMADPGADYNQTRAAYNQQLNDRVQQMHGQYPGNAIATPSAGLPMQRPGPPAALMNNWYGGTSGPTNGGPNGGVVTPQQYPSAQDYYASRQPVDTRAPAVQPTAPRNNLAPPSYAADVVVPPSYQPHAGGWTQPTTYAGGAGGGTYDRPMIVPGN
ncbi:MAG: tetratricopeptide repeat protein [Planctomycetaceae bacterium]